MNKFEIRNQKFEGFGPAFAGRIVARHHRDSGFEFLISNFEF